MTRSHRGNEASVTKRDPIDRADVTVDISDGGASSAEVLPVGS